MCVLNRGHHYKAQSCVKHTTKSICFYGEKHSRVRIADPAKRTPENTPGSDLSALLRTADIRRMIGIDFCTRFSAGEWRVVVFVLQLHVKQSLSYLVPDSRELN